MDTLRRVGSIRKSFRRSQRRRRAEKVSGAGGSAVVDQPDEEPFHGGDKVKFVIEASDATVSAATGPEDGSGSSYFVPGHLRLTVDRRGKKSYSEPVLWEPSLKVTSSGSVVWHPPFVAIVQVTKPTAKQKVGGDGVSMKSKDVFIGLESYDPRKDKRMKVLAKVRLNLTDYYCNNEAPSPSHVPVVAAAAAAAPAAIKAKIKLRPETSKISSAFVNLSVRQAMGGRLSEPGSEDQAHQPRSLQLEPPRFLRAGLVPAGKDDNNHEEDDLVSLDKVSSKSRGSSRSSSRSSSSSICGQSSKQDKTLLKSPDRQSVPEYSEPSPNSPEKPSQGDAAPEPLDDDPASLPDRQPASDINVPSSPELMPPPPPPVQFLPPLPPREKPKHLPIEGLLSPPGVSNVQTRSPPDSAGQLVQTDDSSPPGMCAKEAAISPKVSNGAGTGDGALPEVSISYVETELKEGTPEPFDRFNKGPDTPSGTMDDVSLRSFSSRRSTPVKDVSPRAVSVDPQLLLGGGRARTPTATFSMKVPASPKMMPLKQNSVEKDLMEWSKAKLSPFPQIKVTNLSSSWRNGLGFCALVYQLCPELVPMASLKMQNMEDNCRLAFEACKLIGVDTDPIISVQDLTESTVPDKAVVVSLLKVLRAASEEAGGAVAACQPDRLAAEKDLVKAFHCRWYRERGYFADLVGSIVQAEDEERERLEREAEDRENQRRLDEGRQNQRRQLLHGDDGSHQPGFFGQVGADGSLEGRAARREKVKDLIAQAHASATVDEEGHRNGFSGALNNGGSPDRGSSSTDEGSPASRSATGRSLTAEELGDGPAAMLTSTTTTTSPPAFPTSQTIAEEMSELLKEEERITKGKNELEELLRCEEDIDPKEKEFACKKLLQLVNARNSIVRRQMQLNIAEKERIASHEYERLKQSLQRFSALDDGQKTDAMREEEKALLEQLVATVNKKNELVLHLDSQEKAIAEDERIISLMADKDFVSLKKGEECVIQ